MTDQPLSFVEDGYDRWERGLEEPVRAAVTAEFSERLRVAGWFGRFRLRLEIEREVARRTETVKRPSPESLF